ncbi:YidH family protein [Methyloceanibacter caenitepidi]|uniref:DUF202 domain-containing protein n=1 Tax=Methyloceanibacter caenitepidi TaxID=1384459 RepID=A0A0A8K7V3_9HYPH|nr:DUF202 domain-containing protein [Methyloceanibacter caenitepidi]BAQ18622.1 hypothetical protein GL4_3191 [Methyloceanibacter caenitepidi]
MIKSYTDHAANERTFLAWMRTGVAIIAFGFLIDRFDLFVMTMAEAVDIKPEAHTQLERMSRAFGLSTGVWFILVGVFFIVAATVRFLRTRNLLLDEEIHKTGYVMEFVLAGILAVLIVIASVPLLTSAL